VAAGADRVVARAAGVRTDAAAASPGHDVKYSTVDDNEVE
jgi:hypothetical protein